MHLKNYSIGDRFFMDKDFSQEEREFSERHQSILSISFMKTLLGLAYYGPRNQWELKNNTGLRYASVHSAIKSLERWGFVRLKVKGVSAKGGETKIYGLTGTGLLSLLARIPTKIYSSMSAHEFLLTHAGFGDLEQRKDLLDLRELETEKELAGHLLFFFFLRLDEIAEHGADLFPLVFGKWSLLKSKDIRMDIDLPDIGFESLRDHHYGYSKIRTLKDIFTYKFYYRYVNVYSKPMELSPMERPNGTPKRVLRNETLAHLDKDRQDMVEIFNDPNLRPTFKRIAKEIRFEHGNQVDFVNYVESHLRKPGVQTK
jgi:hypothetical protein